LISAEDGGGGGGGGGGKEKIGDFFWLGGGLSYGNAVNFGNQVQLLYGGTAGIWGARIYKSVNINIDEFHNSYPFNNSYNTTDGEFGQSIDYLSFVGPFVKLRWKFIEIAYRGLLGIKMPDDIIYYYYNVKDSDMIGISESNLHNYVEEHGYGEKGSIINWNNHQVTIGLYFAIPKRSR